MTFRKALSRPKESVSKKIRHLPFATFDIETTLIGEGDLTFKDSCVYNGTDYYRYQTPEELVEHLFTHGQHSYYAHNGAGFDFSLIMDALRKRTHAEEEAWLDPLHQGDDRLIAISCYKGKKKLFELRDSFALIPLSLKDATAKLSDTQKGDIGLANGIEYNPDNPEHVAYLYADVRGLFEVLTNFENVVLTNFGTSIGYTAGSTALAAWRASIKDGHVYFRLNKGNEDFARRGYYGGFVYPGTTIEKQHDLVTLDYNGAYASRMRQGVPSGYCSRTKHYYEDTPGIYEVYMTVPKDIDRPVIPHKEANGNLIYSTGTFTTIATSQELEYARSKGCSFEVIEGIIFERLEYPFEDFINRCEAFELEDDGKLKAIAKLFRNALYGKFGTKSVIKRWHISLDGEIPNGSELMIDEQTGLHNPHFYATWEETDADYMMPHWAAWITASQRIALMQAMDLFDCVHYGDTDSLVVDRTAFETLKDAGTIKVGKGYGTLKVEKYWQVFASFGPKNYGGIDSDGVVHNKGKGIPRKLFTLTDFNDYTPYNPVSKTFHSVRSAHMSLLHPELPLTTKRDRKRSTLLNSHAWKLQDTRIIPLHVEMHRLQLE